MCLKNTQNAHDENKKAIWKTKWLKTQKMSKKFIYFL